MTVPYAERNTVAVWISPDARHRLNELKAALSRSRGQAVSLTLDETVNLLIDHFRATSPEVEQKAEYA